MKKLLLLLTLLPALGLAQQPDLKRIADSISAEGRLLYRLEKAVWHGSDQALRQFPELKPAIGGYFSYESGAQVNFIFYDRAGDSVLAEVAFDRTMQIDQAVAKKARRAMNATEKDIYGARKKTLELLQRDTLFKQYRQTSFNIIPVVTPAEKRLYVLTAPQVHGVVILGSDYLLRFDPQNNLLSRSALHPTILPMEFNPTQPQDASHHPHTAAAGDFISATDICTLMLYSHYPKWKKHSVVGDNYVSVWDCTKHVLTIVPKKQFMEQAQKE